MLSTLALVSTLALTSPANGDSFVIQADRVHIGDGTVLEDGMVLVKDGKIANVGVGLSVNNGTIVVEHEGDLAAGFVALRDYSGLGSEGRESTRTSMPEASLAYAFNPDHSSMEALIQAGVTSFVLSPLPGSNVILGQPAVVKPGARVVTERAALSIDLSSSGRSFNRYPSSIPGQMEVLERAFGGSEGAAADAAAGKLPVVIEVDSRAQVQRALALAGRFNLSGYLVGNSRSGEVAATVKASGFGVALPIQSVGMDAKLLASAASLAKHGVPLGFEIGTAGPQSLRLSAARYVHAGLSRDAAFQALTSGGAALAGVGDRVGSIRTGMDADIVLWSGDPVDPRSKLMAVYIDGEMAFEAPEEEDEEEE